MRLSLDVEVVTGKLGLVSHKQRLEVKDLGLINWYVFLIVLHADLAELHVFNFTFRPYDVV